MIRDCLLFCFIQNFIFGMLAFEFRHNIFHLFYDAHVVISQAALY